MQDLRLGFFVAVFLMVVPGCNKKDGDADTAGPVGRDCQSPSIAGATYICPEGFFCRYKNEADALHPNKLGECEPMEQYKPCMNTVLCGSQYYPRCETVNETAYCDWLDETKRCRCDKPGPFSPVEVEDGGDVKTPTTTR